MKKNELVSKWVKFRIGRPTYYGRVVSIEHDVANIRGIEEGTRVRPSYHMEVYQLDVCSQEDMLKIGRREIKQPR